MEFHTGKSLSEALIFALTNPQYDDKLFIELQVQYMKIPSSNPGRTCCVQKLFLTFRTISVHNMFSPSSAKIRASDKGLPVPPIGSSSFETSVFCLIHLIHQGVKIQTSSIENFVQTFFIFDWLTMVHLFHFTI